MPQEGAEGGALGSRKRYSIDSSPTYPQNTRRNQTLFPYALYFKNDCVNSEVPRSEIMMRGFILCDDNRSVTSSTVFEVVLFWPSIAQLNSWLVRDDEARKSVWIGSTMMLCNLNWRFFAFYGPAMDIATGEARSILSRQRQEIILSMVQETRTPRSPISFTSA